MVSFWCGFALAIGLVSSWSCLLFAMTRCRSVAAATIAATIHQIAEFHIDNVGDSIHNCCVRDEILHALVVAAE